MEATLLTTKPGPSKAVRTWARILTGLLAAVWCFFGVQFFINPEAATQIHQWLGYPLYIVPVIGITHILGGLGLLVPNRPRFTEWVYSALMVDLALTAVSHLSSGPDRFENTLHPVVLAIPMVISYVLRHRVGPNLWSNNTQVGA